MATYRVRQLYCAGCRVVKRCRVEVLDGGMEVYPNCAECGYAIWYESVPSSQPDEPVKADGAIPDDWHGIAPLADVQEFFGELAQKQSEFLRDMFGRWLDEKNDRQQTERDAEARDIARMWRDVYETLTDAE